MKVEHQKHSVIIKDTQGNLESFVEKLSHEYKSFEKENIIVDLTQHKELTIKQLNLLGNPYEHTILESLPVVVCLNLSLKNKNSY